jgi:hypothetical protein
MEVTNETALQAQTQFLTALEKPGSSWTETLVQRQPQGSSTQDFPSQYKYCNFLSSFCWGRKMTQGNRDLKAAAKE